MIKVLSSGFFTTIQDLGRFGFGDIGVPVSGAMDLYSAKLGNSILGNRNSDAVLEITLDKCKLRFDVESIICISGADLSPKLNSKQIPLNSVLVVNKDDTLIFGKSIYGVRSYLAVKGGFQTEIVLKSRSFYKGITNRYILKKMIFYQLKSQI